MTATKLISPLDPKGLWIYTQLEAFLFWECQDLFDIN